MISQNKMVAQNKGKTDFKKYFFKNLRCFWTNQLTDHSTHSDLFLNYHLICTVCPRISDPFYVVSYYIKRVTTSWTHSKCRDFPVHFIAKMFMHSLPSSCTLLQKMKVNVKFIKKNRINKSINQINYKWSRKWMLYEFVLDIYISI